MRYAVAPHFPFVQRVLFANRWLFGPLIEAELSKANTTNALLRTTTAPTMLSASIQQNVLPQEAKVTVNFRSHPRGRIDDIIDHVNKVITDDRVKVVARPGANDPSKISTSQSDGYRLLDETFGQVFGDIVSVPGLTIAATDSREYEKSAENSYRILPIVFNSEDIPRLQGTNERISIDAVKQAIIFYQTLIGKLR